jgi:DNA invertase Pin-like site-specific DNA recombinase
VREVLSRVDPDAIVVAVYDDNDMSASNKRKKRPGFERIQADLKAGVIDAVACWHLDRLTRHTMELEHLCQLSEERGSLFMAVHGDIDLRTSIGRMTARMLAAVARREVEGKAERQRAANWQRACVGESWSGGMRCYGYDDSGKHVIEEEAAIIREMADRLLPVVENGVLKRPAESLRSLVMDLDRRGIKTTTGRPWQTVTLRRLLQNPRLIGVRMINGVKAAENAWPPILTPEQQAKLVAMFKDPSRQKGDAEGRVRKYLLSGGLVRCGLCGKPLQSQKNNRGKPGYVCRKAPPVGGCGRIRVNAEQLDTEVAGRVLARYASPAVRQRLMTVASAMSESTLMEQINELEERLAELGREYADGEIALPTLKAAQARTHERLAELRAQINQSARLAELPAGLGPKELAEWWVDAPLDKRRALVRTVLEHIDVGPVTRRGVNELDLDRLNWVWK